MRKFIIIGLTLLMFGCSVKPHIPFNAPRIDFKRTPIYKVDDIQKPSNPSQILLTEQFKPTENKDIAKYVAFAPNEFAKVVALNQYSNELSDLVDKQEELINTDIATINSLKELIAIKEQMIDQYIVLWSNAENQYRVEKREHTITRIENKATWLGVAGMVVLAITL